jgi:NAD(P)-dependent dehydrogenase (short-subunit alcohol dehydrogenase family)
VPLGSPRVAVVTGGSSGIGASVARRLASDGWTCVLIGRREDPLRALASEIGGEFEVCDVSDREAVDAAAAAVESRHSALGLLLNNAGVAGRRMNFLDGLPERIEELIEINYLGNVWVTRAFLPLLEAGDGAQVANVVSVAGTVALGPYSASKHAQLALSRSLAAELRPRGIHVLTVNPGFVETPGFPQAWLGRFEAIVVGPDYVAKRIVQALKLGRSEIFVPGWYRTAAWGQALTPGALARVRARRLGRRGTSRR